MHSPKNLQFKNCKSALNFPDTHSTNETANQVAHKNDLIEMIQYMISSATLELDDTHNNSLH